MARRKHRKVKGVPAGWKGCKCPKGARKVSTCSTKKGAKVCKGRGWGCLGVGTSQRGKPSPRFVRAICPDATTKALPAPPFEPEPRRLGPGSAADTKLSRAIARTLSR